MELEQGRKPLLIIDTDPGHDDAFAIMLIEASNQFEIVAITTVAGNASIQCVTNNARFLLDLMQVDYPLHSGAGKPLRQELVVADVHGEGGLGGTTVTKVEPLSDDAVSVIVRLVRDNPNQVSILALGPLTNIAQAFQRDPELPILIDQIVIMGGAIEVPGNKNRTAEFNFFVDPDAASIVFDSMAKKVLIPLDVCNSIVLTEEDFSVLQDTTVYPVISSMLREYIKGIKQYEKFDGALMYDVLAAYALMKPTAYQSKNMDVRIETEGHYTRGMSVAERRSWGSETENCTVVTFIDKGDFSETFFSLLKQRFS